MRFFTNGAHALFCALGLIALLVLMSPTAHSDHPGSAVGRVVARQVYRSSADITAAAPVEVGASTLYSDTIRLKETRHHSVVMTITATNTVNATAELEQSSDGTNFRAFSPSVSVSLTTSGLDKCWPLNVPVTPYARWAFGAGDVPYDVTECIMNCE